jgi:antitoxin YqcF
MKQPVSEINKTIAKHIAAAFGQKPRVTRYWDNDKKAHVDIAEATDQPQTGVTSYGTIGLSDAPLMRDGKEYPARLELVGACASSFTNFGNVLATAAFCIINSKWFCAPGIIFPDVVKMYAPKSPLHHLMFVPPFLWEEKLTTLEAPEKTVTWLLVVPISDSELAFAEKEGPSKLEDVFEQRGIDIFDISRAPVV